MKWNKKTEIKQNKERKKERKRPGRKKFGFDQTDFLKK